MRLVISNLVLTSHIQHILMEWLLNSLFEKKPFCSVQSFWAGSYLCWLWLRAFKGVARETWGAHERPFCKPFLTKQPRTGGENATTFQLENIQTNKYPHFDTVWPLLWKILATPMRVLHVFCCFVTGICELIWPTIFYRHGHNFVLLKFTTKELQSSIRSISPWD